MPRPGFAARHPVHVTMKVQPGVGFLRAQRRASLVLQTLREASDLRVIHYSVQGNHVHLIVEATDAPTLSRGMQRVATRLARRLNSLDGRRGGVFTDRYHARALTTPREVKNAIRYVLGNFRHHARESLPRGFVDPLASRTEAPLSAPTVWLLRVGWRL